jgi:hypothetical protein
MGRRQIRAHALSGTPPAHGGQTQPLPLSGRHDSEPGSESLGGGIMVPGCSPLTQAESELAAALASWLTEVQWPGPLALTHLGAQAAACVHL